MKNSYKLALLIIVAMIGTLIALGRSWWCPELDYAFASFNIKTRHNSQHLLDPFSFSHFEHGVIFFIALVSFKKISLAYRFNIALALEAAWEIFENTSYVIDRYRTATIALNYYGDSILNSVSDLTYCALGFYLASKLSLKVNLVILLAIELFLLYWIKDNLTLNILMLVYPLEVIKEWQGGGSLERFISNIHY